MPITTNFEGIKEEILTITNDRIVEVVGAYMESFIATAPVDTGNLRNSFVPHSANENPPITSEQLRTREAREAHANQALSIQQQAMAELENYDIEEDGDIIISNPTPYLPYVNESQGFLEQAISLVEGRI